MNPTLRLGQACERADAHTFTRFCWGIGFVLAEPGRYLRLSLSRVPDYFEFWPTDTTLLHNVGRLLSFTLYLPFMLYGLYLAGKAASQRDSRTAQQRISVSMEQQRSESNPHGSRITHHATRNTHHEIRNTQHAIRNTLQSPLGLLYLFMFFYSVLHILTWAMPRYRLPVDAAAMPFAALGFERVVYLASRKAAKGAKGG